jgi:hypothetical protein
MKRLTMIVMIELKYSIEYFLLLSMLTGKKKEKEKLLFARNWNECRFILERKFDEAERKYFCLPKKIASNRLEMFINI